MPPFVETSIYLSLQSRTMSDDPASKKTSKRWEAWSVASSDAYPGWQTWDFSWTLTGFNGIQADFNIYCCDFHWEYDLYHGV